METEPISDFFNREVCCKALGRKSRASTASTLLLEGLEIAGYRGRSVLDLGCGLANVSLEMVARGAARATGIDLSERSVEAANRRAAAAGLQEQTRFVQGDAATAALSPHDIVVLDKVICCYPDAEGLVHNSVAAAGSIYAFSLPASRGVRGLLGRITIALENSWRRITGDPFRAYVHDVDRIDAEVRAAGFSRVHAARRLVWSSRVYARSQS